MGERATEGVLGGCARANAWRREIEQAMRLGRLGCTLRGLFLAEYGLKPMEDPRMDCTFLDKVDEALGFKAWRSAVIEGAFYDAEVVFPPKA